MTTHTLRLVAVWAAVIAAISIAVASAWSYPEWAWLPIFLGFWVGTAIAIVSTIVLLRRRLFAPQ